jgi:hypothetical protein
MPILGAASPMLFLERRRIVSLAEQPPSLLTRADQVIDR